ncbi:MAG TPA: ATP-binding protein [Desulfuromonadales bacterium]|nr:ATP-binding protein [Desulfuromonadales bacterium]
MIQRIVQLPETQSFFLFGPRQTGKSSLVQSRFADAAWTVSLLHSEDFIRYSKHPGQYRLDVTEKVAKGFNRFILDEVQRIPALLNEVHSLMEQFPACQFIMLGSSARKLMRGGANLLGGRAVRRFLFPFTREELGDDFRLDDALRFGTLPPLTGLSDEHKQDILRAYSDTYLREEIQMEGLVRNLGGFYRFLEVAASASGEMLNFTNIARECQLQARSVQSYYEILEDTLIGFRLMPWLKSERKRLVAHPKFYFFDTGITNAVNRRLSEPPDSRLYGRLFEQYMILEAYRQIHYSNPECRLFFWRTNTGAEVDLLFEKHGRLTGAFEFKSSVEVGGDDFSGLRAFRTDNPGTSLNLVYRGLHPYETDGIKVVPWQHFLTVYCAVR